MDQLIIVEKFPQHTVLTLNRPNKRNALTAGLLKELKNQLITIQETPDQRAVFLKGEGPVFCSGMDLNEASQSDTLADALADALSALYLSPLITVSFIHGGAIGGGAGLMSATDFVVADPQTVIGYPETRIGLVPALVINFLMRQLRQRDVRELVLLGELITAQKALEMGLISRIVEHSRFNEEMAKFLDLVLKTAPEATKETKKLIDIIYPATFEEDIYQSLNTHKHVRESEEAHRGIEAFLTKTELKW